MGIWCLRLEVLSLIMACMLPYGTSLYVGNVNNAYEGGGDRRNQYIYG